MLDERDLQAIAQIIDSKIQESEQRMTTKIQESEQRMTAKIEASEQRMNAKIGESASQTLKEAMQGAAALMESYFEPKFNLLFENQLETLAPKSRVDELEEEVSVLRSVVRQHSRDIELLKHA